MRTRYGWRDMPKDPAEIGAMWEKMGPKGPYLTGTINGEPVVVFRNATKTGNQPDWRVLKARPRPRQADTPKPASKPAKDDDLDTAF